MTTYVINRSNWNDPAFWASIVETGDGQRLDFSRLGSAFTIHFEEWAGRITIRDIRSSPSGKPGSRIRMRHWVATPSCAPSIA